MTGISKKSNLLVFYKMGLDLQLIGTGTKENDFNLSYSNYNEMLETIYGLVDNTDNKAITLLKNHSDCDGSLSYDDCKLLSAMFEDIAKDIDKDDDHLSKFVKLVKSATKHNTGIKYC